MNVSVILELPDPLLEELREIAAQRGIPLEQAVEEALAAWAIANAAVERPSWDWEKIRPVTHLEPKPN